MLVRPLRTSPPERAILLCVDEKSQIQALNRSQPMLPVRLLALKFRKQTERLSRYRVVSWQF
jgi:hypothetical protein